MNDIIPIGAKINARGFEFQVIANEEQSHYGYCPPKCIIVRNRAGDTIMYATEVDQK